MSPKCSNCGAALAADAPAGLCPKCLMALNLKTETIFSGDAPTAEAPLPPEQIAPHFPQLEILEFLGRGGMGVVYKARQKTLNRIVALKLLAPERVGDPKFAERFAREAQALAALNHPNIVTIHDFGQAGGFYFLLMEFVDGANLRQLLRAQKFTPEEALAIVPPLCEALQYAHERGIVHRDIKPENLLLDRTGRVKIADFGIAKMLGANDGGKTGATAGGEASTGAMGTRGYSAPEQQEQPQRVDNRVDIYSLGVVLYEMLTGELPGKTIEPPSRKVHIDVRLDAVVLRALEKTPELRWQTAADLRTQVETIVAESGTAAERSPTATVNPGVTISPQDAIVLRGVENWLALFDQGDYGRTWETAAKSFQKAVARAEWMDRGNITRQPLGRVLSRRVRRVRRFAKWFSVKYDTVFVGLKSAVETVTFSRESDGKWRAVGYLILPAYAEEDRTKKVAREAIIFSGLATFITVVALCCWPRPTTYMIWAMPVLALVGIINGLRAKQYRLGKIGVWVGLANLALWVMAAVVLFFLAQVRVASGGANSKLDLADSPPNLQKASTAAVIQAGLSKPLSPWVWQELEQRHSRPLTTNEVARIMDGLTAWLQQKYPAGDSEPMNWLDDFLNRLAETGKVTDDQKIRFLTALNGDLRGDPKFRVREGDSQLSTDFECRYRWRDDLMGMVMMNEVQSVTVDGQTVKRSAWSGWNWDMSDIWQTFELPKLAPGKHHFKMEVLSALVAQDELPGISRNAPSPDWPAEKKRWVRAAERDLTIYTATEPMIGETDDPALEPLQSDGLVIKEAIMRPMGGHTHAVLTFNVSDKLPVDISFNVALRVGGQTVDCGQLYAFKDSNGQITIGNAEFTADLVRVDFGDTNAEVILTPNPKPVETNPMVDRIWGKEIIFSKVGLRWLDAVPGLDMETGGEPYLSPVHQAVLDDSGQASCLNLDNGEVLPKYTGEAAGISLEKSTRGGVEVASHNVSTIPIAGDRWQLATPKEIFRAGSTNGDEASTTNRVLETGHAYIFRTDTFVEGLLRVDRAGGNNPHHLIVSYKTIDFPVTFGPVEERTLDLTGPDQRALKLASGNFALRPATAGPLEEPDIWRQAGADLYVSDRGEITALDMQFWDDSNHEEKDVPLGAPNPWAAVEGCNSFLWWLERYPFSSIDTNSPDLQGFMAAYTADQKRRQSGTKDIFSGTNVCFFETRHGLGGVLQIGGYVGDPSNPSAMKIRYRLIKKQ